MLIGHKKIWDFLIKSARQERLAHAYLFFGPAEIGKKTLALEFAKRLLCQNKKNDLPCQNCQSCRDIEKNSHPDVFALAPRQEEKKGVLKTYEIGIGEINSLRHQLSLSPYCSLLKIAIIDDSDKMTNEAVNSFLKTLEEPSAKSLIFLITSRKQAILPTIFSRCQAIGFSSVAQEEIIAGLKYLNFSELISAKATKLCAGRPGQALKICRNREILENRERNFEIFSRILKTDLVGKMELAGEMSQNIPQARETLSEWLLFMRDGLLANLGCGDLALGKNESCEKLINSQVCAVSRQIQKTKNILGNSSFDSKLALEVMMMKI